jgi:ferritin
MLDVPASPAKCLTAPVLFSFISEQIEEEKRTRQIVDRLRMVGEGTAGILVLDHHLAKRGS